MTKKKETTTGIKKPILVLNDKDKFYLATQEVTGESMSGLFFVLSLFLPVKNGATIVQPHTEINAFDDANSASVYYETLARYCDFNAKSDNMYMVKEAIDEFNKNANKIIEGYQNNGR